MTDNNREVSRPTPKPHELAAYQMGQALVGQLFDQDKPTGRRTVRTVQREAHVVNGELHIVEREVEVEEDDYYTTDSTQESWISRIFGF